VHIIVRRLKRAIAFPRPVKNLAKSGAAIITLMAIFTACFIYIENVTWVEGFWQAWQTFTTVGYGNRPANSSVGIFLTIIIGTVGISVLAMFITNASELRSYFRERTRLGFMKNKFKNGYVIINFPGIPESLRMIEQLRQAEPDVPLCFVDSGLEGLPPTVQILPDIHYVKGDLSDQNTFERANIDNCKAVVVYPDNPDSENADLVTKAVVDLVCDFAPPSVHVLYILCVAKKQGLFPKRARGILKNMWVLSLVQEFQSESAAVIEKLLSNTDNESINLFEFPKGEIEDDVDWENVVNTALYSPDALTPIALLRKGADSPLLTVPHDQKISPGDKIYFASPNDMNLKKKFYTSLVKEVRRIEQEIEYRGDYCADDGPGPPVPPPRGA